jgi:hypothetical protein
MAPNSLQHKAAIFCLSQSKANEPGAISVVPDIPEQEVLRRIIELADPWYGQDKWDLCTVCDKMLCSSCVQEGQKKIQANQSDWDSDLPCCLRCADMVLTWPWDFLDDPELGIIYAQQLGLQYLIPE